MEITRHGTAIMTNGTPTAIGEKLPAFTVKDAQGHSLTKHFNEDMDAFDNVDFYTISTNTPQEQQTWCAAENVKKMQLLSDQDADFGKAMGLFVADNHTDARSVWIIDDTGTVKYRELITEQTHEPDYTSALAYLEAHQH